MNVVWLARRDFTDSRGGGAERTIEEIGKRLASRGHQVTVVSGSKAQPGGRTRLEGIQSVRLGSFGKAHLLAPLLLSRFGDDSVVVDDLAHVVPWLSNWTSRFPVTPFFHHLHARTLGGQVPGSIADLLSAVERSYPLFYPKGCWITESESAYADLQTLGVPPEAITKIPPGVDSETFRPTQKTETPTLVYFAGLRGYKRPDHAVLALNELRSRGVPAKLRIVGEGPMLFSLRALVRNLSLEQSVEFLGRIDRASLPSIVGSAWANVHCSTAEGWGFSILEAAAAGVPTVAYSVPGVNETVSDGATGILVVDGSIRGLGTALSSVIADPLIWKDRCRSWAAKWSWDRAAIDWEAHLSRLVEAKRELHSYGTS